MDTVTTVPTAVDSRAEPGRAVTVGQAATALAGIRRPHRALLFYYLLQSIAVGPGVIVMLPMRFFRFRTLRYTFDADGMSMRWGILFRREVSLTYARIQDIHLVSNVIERWLGLGRIQVQTASGSAEAEMTIEGLTDFEAVRDELYARMRGARDGSVPRADAAGTVSTGGRQDLGAVTAALADAVAELRALREMLERDRNP